MRAALEFYLGHNGVHGDGGDDADESIAGAAADGGGIGRRTRLLCREGGEPGAVDGEASGGVARGIQSSGVDPASHGVVAHSEQLGRLANPIMRHEMKIITANASLTPVGASGLLG